MCLLSGGGFANNGFGSGGFGAVGLSGEAPAVRPSQG
jgi:hypothetical protein